MTKENRELFIMVNKNNIPQDKLHIMHSMLDNLKDTKEVDYIIQSFNFKSCALSLLLSIMFGYLGVGRFYIGDYVIGFIKLAVFILVTILSTLFNIYFASLIINIIYIVDLFFIMKATKKMNYEMFNKLILQCNLTNN